MDLDNLKAHAERIRASNVLGRSELMQRLFDFFVECSLTARVPKEIEVAIDVFGKSAGFEVTQDAMVRVYIHKLRRKLEDYYAGPGAKEKGRLVIPRGEYRLVYEEDPAAIAAAIEITSTEIVGSEALPDDPDISEATPPPVAPTRQHKWLLIGLAVVALLLLANVALFLVGYRTPSRMAQEVMEVRDNVLWRQVVADDQPIYIVMGDYYIFGELDRPSPTNPESVRRLVRDFSINSRNDLDQLLHEKPELEERYMDLALRYLPISSAFALHSIVPLLEPNKKNPRQVQLILASDLTPSMIRSSHIIYIGLLSGMGVLRDIAFAGSQFRIGDTYDELIDRATDKTYVSQSSIAINDNTRYRDYGYFSTFAGPSGNRIVILAGTRDVAVMHTAEAVSHRDSLKELLKQSHGAENFEALYAVDAMDRMNLDGKLLLTDKIDAGKIWAGSAAVAVVNDSASKNPKTP